MTGRLTNRKQQGFTLIELVLVIVIIGIIASISFPRFVETEQQANNVKLKAYGAAVETSAKLNYVFVKSKLPQGFSVEEDDVCTPTSLQRFTNEPYPAEFTSVPHPLNSCNRPSGSVASCFLAIRNNNQAVSQAQFKIPCTK